MSLIESAKKDIQTILNSVDEFAINIKLIDTNGIEYALKGLHTKHHIKIDTDGNLINGKNAHLSVSEYDLIELNYPYRNLQGEVTLKNHTIKAKDSTGIEKLYLIDQWFPDETIGMITMILTDLSNG